MEKKYTLELTSDELNAVESALWERAAALGHEIAAEKDPGMKKILVKLSKGTRGIINRINTMRMYGRCRG